MKSIFEGTAVALVTPFDKGEIDYGGVKTLIERNITLGAKALVILATTGEGSTISEKEREKFIKFCIKINANRAKIVVGTGNNNFEKCFDLTKQAKRLGADGALVVTPYYNKTTQKGLVEYYQKLAQLKFPMIMYNVPARTGLMLEIDTIKKILKTNDYIFGIKESTTDIERIKKLFKVCKGQIPVYSGEDGLNYLFYCLGGQGSISVTANVYPDLVQEIYLNAKKGNYCDALELQEKLDVVNEALFYETNPIPVKYYMSLMGLIKSEVRMPLTTLTSKNEKRIKTVYKTFSNLK